jgi:transposase-like protein
MQKNMTPGRRKGCPNYSPEFKQQLVAASCEPGISISKLALENGMNANLPICASSGASMAPLRVHYLPLSLSTSCDSDATPNTRTAREDSELSEAVGNVPALTALNGTVRKASDLLIQG